MSFWLKFDAVAIGFFLILFAINSLAVGSNQDPFEYGKDFNLTDVGRDINGKIDTDFSSDCNITIQYSVTSELLVDGNAMLHDPFYLGKYFFTVPASDTNTWKIGRYDATNYCEDYNNFGAENLSFTIDYSQTKLLTDINTTTTSINQTTLDINTTVHSIQNSLSPTTYEDDLNAYLDSTRTTLVSYGYDLNKSVVVYLLGSATTPLPTNYSLNAKIFLYDINTKLVYEVSASTTFITGGLLYSSFVMPEIPYGDYNILIEAWDSKSSIGNDVIRGATTKLLMGQTPAQSNPNEGGAQEYSEPQLPSYQDQNNVLVPLHFAEEEKEANALLEKQKNQTFLVVLIYLVIMVVFGLVSVVLQKFNLWLFLVVAIIGAIISFVVLWWLIGASGIKSIFAFVMQVMGL